MKLNPPNASQGLTCLLTCSFTTLAPTYQEESPLDAESHLSEGAGPSHETHINFPLGPVLLHPSVSTTDVATTKFATADVTGRYANTAGATGMDSTTAGMYATPAGASGMYATTAGASGMYATTAGATVSRASSVSQWKRAWDLRQWYDQEANTLGIAWDRESNSWLCKKWDENNMSLRIYPIIPGFSQETALFDAVLFRLRNLNISHRDPSTIQEQLGVTSNDMRNLMWRPKESSFVFRVKFGGVSLCHRFNMRDFDDIRKAWEAARDFRDMFEVSRARELVYHRRRMLEKLPEMSMELRRNEIWDWASEHMPAGGQIQRQTRRTRNAPAAVI